MVGEPRLRLSLIGSGSIGQVAGHACHTAEKVFLSFAVDLSAPNVEG